MKEAEGLRFVPIYTIRALDSGIELLQFREAWVTEDVVDGVRRRCVFVQLEDGKGEPRRMLLDYKSVQDLLQSMRGANVTWGRMNKEEGEGYEEGIERDGCGIPLLHEYDDYEEDSSSPPDY